METLLAPGGQALLLGNEAIVRGALEAGVHFISCYPGTPSSEVADTFARLKEECAEDAPAYDLEYSVNEKVALELACGASLAGAQSLCTMKHVGLNVAADPLFTSAYIGLPGGLVLLSADDPGCHSSQNEQDNRAYARFAQTPLFEPASAEEARLMTRAAFTLSRQLEQPVILRSTTRVSHLRGAVKLEPLPEKPVELAEFKREPGRFVPVPQVALKRHRVLAAQMGKARTAAEESPFNRISWPKEGGNPLGIIASGPARNYLADALHELGLEEQIAVFELGQTWPLPEKKLEAFLRDCKGVLVLEEGAALLENDLRSLANRLAASEEKGSESLAAIAGKDTGLTEFGEYSTSLVRQRLERWLANSAPDLAAKISSTQFGADRAAKGAACAESAPKEQLAARPPNLCAGCAHRAVYFAAREIFGDEAHYSSDIGCYTLGLLPPLRTADFLVCMGSSITAGSGFARASGKMVVAFIGDSTFFHSGMSGLANAVFNRHNLLLVILDNGTTAMTGHQPNPGMLQESLGSDATHLDIEAIVRALGVRHCEKVKALNLKKVQNTLKNLAQEQGVRVLIAEEPCVLYARRSLGRRRQRVASFHRQNDEARSCLAKLACPAFRMRGDALEVDHSLCGGCLVCMQVAPNAIKAKNR